MLSLPSLGSHAGARFVQAYRRPIVSTRTSARENHLLAALPALDYARLLPALEHVSLSPGDVVCSPGERQKHLYFLTSGVVSRCYVAESGVSAEFALTGREGVDGVATFLGGEGMPGESVVVIAGEAYRLQRARLECELAQGGALLYLLLRYAHALISQIGQIAVCNRHHSVVQQLCFLILSCQDRSDSHELTLTQELIADMLGVRREGITGAAGHLQQEGMIKYCRGHIHVLDRAKLEQRVCECYAVVKKEYERLLLCKIPAVSSHR